MNGDRQIGLEFDWVNWDWTAFQCMDSVLVISVIEVLFGMGGQTTALVFLGDSGWHQSSVKTQMSQICPLAKVAVLTLTQILTQSWD